MVDFRYHLVSIIAVFLALAVGIVFGTTTLNRQLFDALDKRVTSIDKDRDALRSENEALVKAQAGQSKFAKSVLPFAVGGRLAGERVIIVSSPDSSGAVRDGVAEALLAAGATIGGRIELTKKFLDPTQSDVLESVVRQATNGAPLQEGTPLQQAANQLAIALATPMRYPQPSSGLNAETARVLGAFDDAQLISIDGTRPARSAAVVVLVPLPSKTAATAKDGQVRGVNELIGAFGRQALAVVAVAPTGGAAGGGVLDNLRRDQNISAIVSSVDDGDTAAGQTAVVFAMIERLRVLVDPHALRPPAGHFGDGPAADKPLPDLADIS